MRIISCYSLSKKKVVTAFLDKNMKIHSKQNKRFRFKFFLKIKKKSITEKKWESNHYKSKPW